MTSRPSRLFHFWEVLDAAATKPFGFMRFNPGPGWGGHCLAPGDSGLVPRSARL